MHDNNDNWLFPGRGCTEQPTTTWLESKSPWTYNTSYSDQVISDHLSIRPTPTYYQNFSHQGRHNVGQHVQVEVWQAAQRGRDIFWGIINLSNIGSIIWRICTFSKTFRWPTPVCNSGEAWASQMMFLSADTTGWYKMISMYKIISRCELVRVFIMFTLQNGL